MGFVPANPAIKRPKAHALDRVATGIGIIYNNVINTVIIQYTVLCVCIMWQKNWYNILNMYTGIVATDDMWQISEGGVNSDLRKLWVM